MNYVRSHDDIGWTFSDEDARAFGIDGFEHRRFLNAFYVNRFEGSFARGIPFQDNPRTGDCRISGTTASLAGLEAGDPGAVDRIVLAHSIVVSTGGIPHVLGYSRGGILVLANFSEHPQVIEAERFGARTAVEIDLVSGASFDLSVGLELAPHEFVGLTPDK